LKVRLKEGCLPQRCAFPTRLRKKRASDFYNEVVGAVFCSSVGIRFERLNEERVAIY
jgi:hypothetical protein